MKTVKIRLLNDGMYYFKPCHNRTFPVIVNALPSRFGNYRVLNDDAKAIGMYINPLDNDFCPEFVPGEFEIVE